MIIKMKNILVHMDMKHYIHQIGFHYFFGWMGGWVDGWMVGELESNANLSFQLS